MLLDKSEELKKMFSTRDEFEALDRMVKSHDYKIHEHEKEIN